MEEEFKQEMEDNWDGDYKVVYERNVPGSENSIGFHEVYKVKESTEITKLIMKAWKFFMVIGKKGDSRSHQTPRRQTSRSCVF